jgi:hypothetical protein
LERRLLWSGYALSVRVFPELITSSISLRPQSLMRYIITYNQYLADAQSIMDSFMIITRK